MRLREHLGKLFGKSDSGTATLTADRARVQEMHDRETGQTSGEQGGTRQRMEAELDSQRGNRAGPTPLADVACPHTVLLPRWDAAGDIGHEERATGYTCEACQQQFTAADGRALRQTEAARVRQRLES
ncbi:MAG: hypothetical protein ACYDCQ_21430 [Dehalococcoidia bacterium]